MKKKIFIFGYTGYIGSYLLRYLKDENFETHGVKIFRPTNNNLYDYYSNFIKKFLSENDNIFCIINSAGSINCLTKKDYFFNAQFDVIFQKIIKEQKINIKYLSFNSTKTFSNALDDYALSKKELDKNLINYDNCYSLYIDLVFDDNSPHFQTIQEKIKSIKINILPVFNPGKNFYPINLNSLGDSIKEIINNDYKIKKFIIIGDEKMNFCSLIKHVNSVTNLNKKILYISSKMINYFPKFIKKILLKSKSLQQYDDYNWLSNINKNEFLIRKPNNKF
tara:strand:+ start:945 stop:1778 length:834 start_codon:yes stop_codon:yes gene_type:complete